MKLDSDRFEIRLAQSDQDVAAAQRLRYRVFVEEMGAPANTADHDRRLEIDRYDAHFDHLILVDRKRAPSDPLDQVVGVYRLLPSEKASVCGGFYGAAEYDLSLLSRLGRKSVELGRSCVDADYRGGVAMHLMWQGLADYVLSRNIEILFGVASFHGTDPAAFAQALALLHHHHLAPPELRVRAQPSSYVSMDMLAPEDVDRKTAIRQMPNLIKAYIRLGGVVGEGAFIDYDFNTVDVCLLMDTARMTEKYRNFYSGETVRA